MSSDITKFTTGAVRSSDVSHMRFDLIPPIAMLALARTLAEGAYKYGDCNWELGMTEADIKNHIRAHLEMDSAGDRSEPHLAHAFCGMAFLIHMREVHPELCSEHQRSPGCVLSDAQKSKLERDRDAIAFRRKDNPQPPWSMDELPEIVKLREQRLANPIFCPKGVTTVIAPEKKEWVLARWSVEDAAVSRYIMLKDGKSYSREDKASATKFGSRIGAMDAIKYCYHEDGMDPVVVVNLSTDEVEASNAA